MLAGRVLGRDRRWYQRERHRHQRKVRARLDPMVFAEAVPAAGALPRAPPEGLIVEGLVLLRPVEASSRGSLPTVHLVVGDPVLTLILTRRVEDSALVSEQLARFRGVFARQDRCHRREALAPNEDVGNWSPPAVLPEHGVPFGGVSRTP